MPFKFEKLEIPDLCLVEPKVYRDPRGFFAEIYHLDEFVTAKIAGSFTQVNHSRSGRGVVRGLHYQKNPAAQGKLVRVLAGEIFDVAVDIRKGSPFYGRWVGIRLNALDMKMLYVPEGFAHGFSVISDSAEVEYFCTRDYSPKNERGIHYADTELGIDWQTAKPVVSQKDMQNPPLKLADNNFIYEKK
jgi:dTDP-4-dehydrorhamnose 3,5-epimerase